jgi:hypothetical protein
VTTTQLKQLFVKRTPITLHGTRIVDWRRYRRLLLRYRISLVAELTYYTVRRGSDLFQALVRANEMPASQGEARRVEHVLMTYHASVIWSSVYMCVAIVVGA